MNIEILFQKSFARFKERFLAYLIVAVMGWGLALLFGLGTLILTGIVVGIWFVTKLVALTVLFGVAAGLVSLCALIYIGSWIQLATYDTLISTKKLPPFEVYKRVKPLVGGYVYFSIVLGLFLIGLLPLTLLSLFIVAILWNLWGIFSVFVYLEKQKKGLENLWISRSMVNQKFWPIAGLVLLVLVFIVLVSALFFQAKSGFLVSFVSQFVITPFVTALYYELYLTLKQPAKAKPASVWVGLSILGILVMVVGSIIGFQVLGKAGSDFMRTNPSQNGIYKKLPSLSPTVAG